MMWIIFVLLTLMLGMLIFIIYLVDKINELQMYYHDAEFRKVMIRLNGQKVSHDAEN